MFRLESVANALEQAKQAGGALIAGRPAQHAARGDLELVGSVRPEAAGDRLAGIAFDTDDTLVRRPIRPAAKFDDAAVFHLKGPVIRAVEAVNAPAEFMAGRQLIGSQTADQTAPSLRTPTVSMKEVAAS